MRAAQISEYGDPSVIEINQVDKPTPAEGQVLVEVKASSLNPFDTVVRAGHVKDKIPLEFPVTLGGDIAGVIAEVGQGVSGLVVGDKVYGQAAAVAGNSGALAEFAATLASQVAKIPRNLDFEQAASLPLVGSCAIQALKEHIKLGAGQKLLIHGGAGGIGSIAIQIAKHMGAEVTASASTNDIEFVKQLGADKAIDYKTQDFTAVLSGFDAVFDTTPGDDFNKSLTILKPGGIAVSMITEADAAKAKTLGVRAIKQSTRVETNRLDELRELVESGVVTPQVGKVFPLEQIQQAFTAREAGGTRGKIVISIV